MDSVLYNLCIFGLEHTPPSVAQVILVISKTNALRMSLFPPVCNQIYASKKTISIDVRHLPIVASTKNEVISSSLTLICYWVKESDEAIATTWKCANSKIGTLFTWRTWDVYSKRNLSELLWFCLVLSQSQNVLLLSHSHNLFMFLATFKFFFQTLRKHGVWRMNPSLRSTHRHGWLLLSALLLLSPPFLLSVFFIIKLVKVWYIRMFLLHLS